MGRLLQIHVNGQIKETYELPHCASRALWVYGCTANDLHNQQSVDVSELANTVLQMIQYQRVIYYERNTPCPCYRPNALTDAEMRHYLTVIVHQLLRLTQLYPTGIFQLASSVYANDS